MMSPTLLERLRAWPDLGHYPQLFTLVFGAGDQPGPNELLAAFLAADPVSLSQASAMIGAGDDVAAAQAACDAFAPHIGIRAAEQALEGARANFERRVKAMIGRSDPLREGRTSIRRSLDEALLILRERPAEAELLLAMAEAETREQEQRNLEMLARGLPENSRNAQGDWQLRQAIEAGDLRLANIWTRGDADGTAAPRPLERSSWFDQRPLSDLLDWSLDPTLAPSRFPRAPLDDLDRDLVDRMRTLLADGEPREIDQKEAQDAIGAAIRSLLGSGAGRLEPVAQVEGGGQVWTFALRGPAAGRLFPLIADADEILIVAPMRSTSRLPVGSRVRRFVAWDVCDCWGGEASVGAVVVTPRMLLSALHSDGDRRRTFVRLQSNAIPIRVLLLYFLGDDEARARLLSGAPSIADAPDLAATDVIAPLCETLDLYVDQGDLAALADACGDQLPRLLDVLRLLADHLPQAPSSHRRLDALQILLQPNVERRLEATLVAEIREELGDGATDLTIQLGDAREILEAEAGSLRDSMREDRLAEALLEKRCVENLDEGRRLIEELLALGFLARARSHGEAQPLRIAAQLPLPGRLLLRSTE